MANLGPPVFDFDTFMPITMTVIASYDVGELNLPALFTFLPVTDQSLPPHLNLQKKQGKIKLPPELNRPGEILSMRYDNKVRGIVRSENARSFSHSIIIDVGTSQRIVSVKLSRTLELTGPTSFEIAREAASTILGHVKKCQENLDLLRNNRDVAIKVKQKFLEAIHSRECKIPALEDPLERQILDIYRQQTKGYPIDRISDFLDFMINFNRNLYTGTLELGEFESEMINIQFNLGFSINQSAFNEIMNEYPFESKFNNVKSASAVNVYYNYQKIDRNTGQIKRARHTIRVNRSGHVRHSGPNMESMRLVYNAFMHRVLNNYDKIRSVETSKQQLRILGTPRALSVEEWREFLQEEEKRRQKFIRGDVLMATGDKPSPNQKQGPQLEIIEEPIITLEMIESALPGTTFIGTIDQVQIRSNSPVPSLDFDYKPLVYGDVQINPYPLTLATR